MVRVPNSTNANENFNTGGAIVGGVIGGLLGNQVGGGSGRDVATGVGAIAGAIVGGQGGQQNQNSAGYRLEERCVNVSTPVSEQRQVYSHSSITFIDNGTMVTLNYQR
jgi:uncharacterized protein YcfJ